MTMKGDPHPAATGIFDARERLYGAMLDLMGCGNLPAAYTAVREAQGYLETVRTELEALARVNGVSGELDALEEEESGGAADPWLGRPPGSGMGALRPDTEYHTLDGRTFSAGGIHTINGRPLVTSSGEVRCPDDTPCINHCGTGPCSRSCTVCRRLAGTLASPPCGACPDRDAVVPWPPPDPERKPAASLLSNESLASYAPELPPGIPSSDLDTMLVPWSETGQMLVGVDRGVRVTHTPTGVSVISSSERSQLQNKARAMGMLATHPVVEAYVRASQGLTGYKDL